MIIRNENRMVSETEYNKGLRGYFLIIAVAAEILMSFSFIGFLHIEPVSITFSYIPILFAGCLLGTAESTTVALVFGLASMYKASAYYVMPGDKIFSPFLSGEPVSSLILSVGARVLFGAVIGILYLLARKTGRYEAAMIFLISFFGKTIHSVIVYSTMWVLFPEMGYTSMTTFEDFLNFENMAGMAVPAVIILLCWYFRKSSMWRNLCSNISAARELQLRHPVHRAFVYVMILIVLIFPALLAEYFADRIAAMMRQSGVVISGNAHHDLLLLEIQFMMGMVALTVLFAVLLHMYQLNTAYINHELAIDDVTDISSRRTFISSCEKILDSMDFRNGAAGCFILLDIDHFKNINDTYGHVEGDRILHDFAAVLKECFADTGFPGRLGGDEFAVMVESPVEKEELTEKMKRLYEKIHMIKCGDTVVTCSAGVSAITVPVSVDVLYRRTDSLLYEAKNKGRDRFVIEKI